MTETTRDLKTKIARHHATRSPDAAYLAGLEARLDLAELQDGIKTARVELDTANNAIVELWETESSQGPAMDRAQLASRNCVGKLDVARKKWLDAWVLAGKPLTSE